MVLNKNIMVKFHNPRLTT